MRSQSCCAISGARFSINAPLDQFSLSLSQVGQERGSRTDLERRRRAAGRFGRGAGLRLVGGSSRRLCRALPGDADSRFDPSVFCGHTLLGGRASGPLGLAGGGHLLGGFMDGGRSGPSPRWDSPFGLRRWPGGWVRCRRLSCLPWEGFSSRSRSFGTDICDTRPCAAPAPVRSTRPSCRAWALA